LGQFAVGATGGGADGLFVDVLAAFGGGAFHVGGYFGHDFGGGFGGKSGDGQEGEGSHVWKDEWRGGIVPWFDVLIYWPGLVRW
jgi:hypothetical protein